MRLTPLRIVASLAAVFSLGLACAPLIAQDQTPPADGATAAATPSDAGPRSAEEVYSDLELFG